MYAELIPYALIVALSPMAFLPPVLLLLYSDRPRLTGLTYLAGWLAGIISLITVVIAVAPASPDSAPRTGHRIQIWIGIGLIALGVITWLRRSHYADPSGWFARLQHASPRSTAVIGFLLAVANPKFLLACIAGGVAIDIAVSNPVDKAAAVGYFVVWAGITTALPVLAHLLASRYADKWLDRMRHRVQEHTAGITAITLTAVGMMLILVGTAG
ncbi:GAP family protein [Mycobacterium sp. OTB74]|uniref:GAP family protein n=1 Tax=Mycobacterium sp. OTB74 TaxID=1853452 RepID=UPI002473A1C9|nr:GAP family protein [Mycobacterium sp. OTB74]MDH6247359.1 hypothetical protein [Mycobacterium sp. OTB74]